MFRSINILIIIISLVAAAKADVTPEQAQKIHRDASRSLVAVQYNWVSELRPAELVATGVVIGEEGLVMFPLEVVHMSIPDEQLKDFKIIVPREDGDEQELEAVFLGRDERIDMAFARTKEKQQWKAITFDDVAVDIGEPVVSVGLLPKNAGYRTYSTQANVSALLRTTTPAVLVSGALAAVGSVVYNSEGKALGYVQSQPGQNPLLNDTRNSWAVIKNPPNFYVPARDFLWGLKELPEPGQDRKLSWIGVQFSPVNKTVAEFYGLKDQVVVEVGDVIGDGPAAKAGLKRRNIIVKVNGQALDRGEQNEDAPGILRRSLIRLPVGQTLTLSVLVDKDQPLKDLAIVTQPEPRRVSQAKRYYAEDLGFVAREVVFADTYTRKVPADTKGVVVAMIKPQSAAESGKLRNSDLVTTMNREPVTGLDQFKKAYQDFRKQNSREAVVLVVLRDGKEETIRIEPPQ